MLNLSIGPIPCRRYAIAALFTALSVPLATSHAADRKLTLTRILTRDELRTCMDTSDRIAERRKALERTKPAHDDEMQAINQQAKALATELAQLDTSDERRVNEYNEHVLRHGNVIEQHNMRAAAVNAEIQVLDTEQAQSKEACAHQYRFADKDAILNERRKASGNGGK